MKTCDGCGSDFDDSVELFPRLIVSKEAKVAKKLAEEEGEEMLCLPCWLDAAEGLDQRQLATLLLGMLQKVAKLQQQLHESQNIFPNLPYGGIEKTRPYELPWTTTTKPVVYGPYVGDSPHNPPSTICTSSTKAPHDPPPQNPGRDRGYVAGRWAGIVE